MPQNVMTKHLDVYLACEIFIKRTAVLPHVDARGNTIAMDFFNLILLCPCWSDADCCATDVYGK